MNDPITETSGDNFLHQQFIPLVLTVIVFAILGIFVFAVISSLNLIPQTEHISLNLRWYDILIGAAIYLKTSVDFAIFMGRLMAINPGWKNRVAIEIGTAVGNALGTILILVIWTFFKEIDWLLALMVLIASLVLFELAFSGLEHFVSWQGSRLKFKRWMFVGLDRILSIILKFTSPLLSKIIPDLGAKMKGVGGLPWKKLLFFSFTVPFILGLDDFAGYVPLFSVINVFGFSIGVIGAHMLLNIALFVSPSATVKAVRNEWVSFIGTLAFIGLAIWGLIEVVKIFIH